MNFIEKLAQAKEIKAKRNDAAGNLKFWTIRLSYLTSEKTKAGLNGDFAKVKEIEAEIPETEAALQQSREELASIPPFRPDIKKGWIEYLESYNRDFRKKRKAYEEAKRVLCTSYKELVEQQRKMLCVQKDVLSVLSDKPINSFLITQDLKELMPEAPPVELIPVPSSAFSNTYNGWPTTADAAYFCEANCMSVATLKQIANVVMSRLPSDTKLA